MPHEVLYLEDSSKDRTLEVLRKIQRQDPTVSVIVMSRRFGHQASLSAGIDFAQGDAVLMLDSDLQHPPEIIPRLVEQWRRGAKIIYTVREKTESIGLLKRWSSATYYWILNALSSTEIKAGTADFRLLDRDVVNVLKSMKERHRFLRGMIPWLGFSQAEVRFTAEPRAAGRSKYTFLRMWRMAFDGIVSFSIQPLRMALWLGLAALGVNIAYATFIFYMYFFHRYHVPGWTSLIMLIMLMSSIQLVLIGIIGEYIGRIFEEVKGRPLYVVQQVISSNASAYATHRTKARIDTPSPLR